MTDLTDTWADYWRAALRAHQRVVVAAALAACFGCVPLEPAIQHAQTQRAANEGHAEDLLLPDEARQIGEANAKAWAAQEAYLRGE